MDFRERYRAALVFKDLDVEETIDRRFHRPLAAALTALALSTPLTPNQITLMSLAAGWSGSFLLYQAFFGQLFAPILGPAALYPILLLPAGFFLFASVILDCADGQLARARGGGTRVGRILDGFVDVLVLLPAYVLIGFGIRAHFDALWFWVAVIAGVTTWVRTIVYDQVRGRYVANTTPQAGASAGVETREDVLRDLEEARRGGSFLERFLLRVYLVFLSVQERLSPSEAASAPVERNAQEIAEYRRAHRPTMRLASYLGLGTHMLVIYTSVAAAAINLSALPFFQLILAALFTPLLVVVLIRARTM